MFTAYKRTESSMSPKVFIYLLKLSWDALHKMSQCVQRFSALNARLLSGRIHQLHPSPHPHLVRDSFFPHIMYFSTLLATGHNLIIYNGITFKDRTNGITFKDRTQLELFLQAFPGREFMFLWILIPNSSRVKAWSLKAASRYGIVNSMSYCSQRRQGTWKGQHKVVGSRY